jgi:hypothetical protein
MTARVMDRSRPVRALIGLARCPTCAATVYLSVCEGYEQAVDILAGEQLHPVEEGPRRWWRCEHMGPIRRYRWGWTDTPHRWESMGPIELRPVLALHVDVVAR